MKGRLVVKQLFSVEDARRRAKKRLPRMMFDFIDGASGDETLCDLNPSAINQVRLMPRVLIDISERDLSSTILGQKTGLPFGIAPMGMCALAWPGADQAMAREAARRRIPLCVSTASSMTLERVNDLRSLKPIFCLLTADTTPQLMLWPNPKLFPIAQTWLPIGVLSVPNGMTGPTKSVFRMAISRR